MFDASHSITGLKIRMEFVKKNTEISMQERREKIEPKNQRCDKIHRRTKSN